VELDSYRDAGVLFSVDLVNDFAVAREQQGPMSTPEAMAALARILAVDPPTVAAVRPAHVPAFTALAQRLCAVFADLAAGDVDMAAGRVNKLLAEHPAHPHLTKEDGTWRLHHHPADAKLMPMMTAICAEGLARFIGTDNAHRLGTCGREGCGRVYVDTTKNASRRFCCTACQNRVKAAAFRERARGS
jgi:predicted RNA-binding Zn ribbon-like protein